MAEELFRSDDLLVRAVLGHDSACCVVTFDSFTDFRTLDRPGFGEAFLQASGIDAIHVLSRDNDWYHYPEMAEAMACVHGAAAAYPRVVTYGSSMGAYAAIRFAGLVGAHAVLALSPQFSIDRATVPWERRWLACSKRFDNRWERALPLPAVAEAYVIYDPVNADKRHIALLAARFAFTAIGIRFGGHPVTGLLAELGLLQELAIAVCQGRLDEAGFTSRVIGQRHQSPQYLINLSDGTPAKYRDQRLALLRCALQLAPDNPGVMCCLAIELARADYFAEALALHRRTLELAPDHPNMLLHYSASLEWSGDSPAALAVMEQLNQLTHGAPIYRARLAKLRKRYGADGQRKELPHSRIMGWVVARWESALPRNSG
jgi:pimeloyl-ACP methyl ester carboxylesterase